MEWICECGHRRDHHAGNVCPYLLDDGTRCPCVRTRMTRDTLRDIAVPRLSAARKGITVAEERKGQGVLF